MRLWSPTGEWRPVSGGALSGVDASKMTEFRPGAVRLDWLRQRELI